jgi:hypothetical protein
MKSLSHRVSVAAALCLQACSSAPEPKEPAKAEPLPRPSPDQQRDLRQAERLFLERKADWPAERDRLARDPVTGGHLMRMLIFHSVESYRFEPPHGDDLTRALAGITPETLLSRCLAEFRVLGAAAVDRVFDDLVASRSTENRQVGLLLLTTIGGPAVPRLRQEAKDEGKAEVRRAAIQGLGAFAAEPAVLADLSQLALDRDWQVRAQAVAALGYGVDEASCQLLARAAASDSDQFVRRKAIQALGVRGSPAAADALVEILARGVADRSTETCNEAQAALRRITRKDLGWQVEAWRAWLLAHPATRPTPGSEEAGR